MPGWQDLTFLFGGLFFAVALVPTLRSKTAEVPLSTSLTTALILAVYAPAEWTVGLRLAAIAGAFSSGAWLLIALLRHPKKHTEIRFPMPCSRFPGHTGPCNGWPCPERRYLG